jgi:hypothetical protein
MDSLCCMYSSHEHMFNMRSFDSWTRYKRTTKLYQLCHATRHLWSLQQQLQFPLPLVAKDIISGIMSGEHGGQDHPQPRRFVNRFNSKGIPNTSCRTFKTAFALCGRSPPCWKNVVFICSAPWMIAMSHSIVANVSKWCVFFRIPVYFKYVIRDCIFYWTLIYWRLPQKKSNVASLICVTYKIWADKNQNNAEKFKCRTPVPNFI